ncbi:hypothetical protein [Streptomyces sp. Ag109_G2-15]|uniref:hypothetical protein n=1 Tax=Streptomyces sp. Ag109_G2-15 TaxID=1938850 RepID=UPI000BD60272|nr:hypothetical protein [Streptomyces sp. Ag109_G2-15]SOD84978.1 hypothetical protein SAMN06272765_2374 [Streptomyces sp. Ag109_G2-15]
MTDATRRTLRTAVQTLVALVPLLAGEPAARDAPAVAGVVAVAAALTRLMSLPEVERLLPSWLRREESEEQPKKESP